MAEPDVPRYDLYDADGNNFNFSSYKGNLSMQMWVKGERRPVFSQNFPLTSFGSFKKTVKSLLKMGPGSVKTIVFQQWDERERKYTPGPSLSFVKNDNKIYEIKVSAGGIKKTFQFTDIKKVSYDSEPNTPENLSVRGFNNLIEMLDTFFTYVLDRTYVKPQRGGGDNKGGGDSRSRDDRGSGYGGGGSDNTTY